MPIWLGTMRFELGIAGWTESWFADKADSKTALDSLEKCAKKRAVMLSAQAFLVGIRVSDIKKRGDAHIRMYPGAGVSDKDATTRVSDYVTQGWYCQFQTAEGSRRALQLRGQPDSAYDLNTNLVNVRDAQPSGYMLNAFNAYWESLRSEGWGIYGNDVSLDNPERLLTDVKLVNSGVNNAYVLTVTGGAWAVGDYLTPYRLSGQYPELSGKLRVKIVSGNDLTLFKIARTVPIPAYDNDGAVRKWIPGVRTITNAFFVRMSKRDTGRPFGVPVGRRLKDRRGK